MRFQGFIGITVESFYTKKMRKDNLEHITEEVCINQQVLHDGILSIQECDHTTESLVLNTIGV